MNLSCRRSFGRRAAQTKLTHNRRGASVSCQVARREEHSLDLHFTLSFESVDRILIQLGLAGWLTEILCIQFYTITIYDDNGIRVVRVSSCFYCSLRDSPILR